MFWGYRERGTSTWGQLSAGDVLLFYTGQRTYEYAARISDTQHNRQLAEAIFETPDDPFEYIVLLDDLIEIDISSPELHETFAGYNLDHPVRSQPFNDAVYEAIDERYGSVEQYLRAHRTDLVDPDDVVVTVDQTRSERAAPDTVTPRRTETTVNRIVRDTAMVDELKHLYDHQCQVCGDVRYRGASTPYAEGHHLHPLGASPLGPDEQANILVLCPNHHSDFDYGTIRADPTTLEIEHLRESAVDGTQLTVHDDHPLERRYLEYHDREITDI